MGELSQLRKQQTEQKKRSEPQNSLQENLVPRFSPIRFYGATGRREPWERGWLQEKQERHQKLLEGLQRSRLRSYCHEYL